MFRFFESFIAKMKASFRRIASATRHDVAIDDLQQDAWVLAQEIGERRGREIDFSDPADQDLILRAVNVKNVKRGDWKLRRSVRIDSQPENEDGAPDWKELLPAPASSGPLVALLQLESAVDANAMLASSYSQAAAYVAVFVHFKNSREQVCSYLLISAGTLARRVTRAANAVRVQPSLFDRIERIGSNFLPPPGRKYVVSAVQAGTAIQLGWEF